MRGLILAAGKGTFAPDNLPPVMTPLAGRTLLERQIAALRAGGVTEIGVVRGYYAAAVKAADVTWFDHPRWAETGDVAQLCAAAEWLRSGTVVVCDADVFFRHEFVHAIGTVRGTLVVGFDRKWRELWTRRFRDLTGQVAAFRRGPAGNLLDIGGLAEDAEGIQGQPNGVLKFTPTAWQAVEAFLGTLEARVRDHLDIGSLLHWLLDARSIAIGTVGTDGQGGRVTSAADVALYEQMAAAGELALEG
ncbi:MAG: NTP transferase domain-containing protein [Proteobacteria bacterium]|nr:NTP transferase domain-containing protein [Pseudomonadota bacterium]